MDIAIPEPRIIEHVNLTIVGLQGNQDQTNDISSQIGRYANTVKNIIIPALVQVLWTAENGQYEVLMGYAVSGVEDLPDGLTIKPLSISKALIFGHFGSSLSFRDLVVNIHGQWFPTSGYTYDHSDATQVQFVSEAMMAEGVKNTPGDQNFIWELWVPVQLEGLKL